MSSCLRDNFQDEFESTLTLFILPYENVKVGKYGRIALIVDFGKITYFKPDCLELLLIK